MLCFWLLRANARQDILERNINFVGEALAQHIFALNASTHHRHRVGSPSFPSKAPLDPFDPKYFLWRVALLSKGDSTINSSSTVSSPVAPHRSSRAISQRAAALWEHGSVRLPSHCRQLTRLLLSLASRIRSELLVYTIQGRFRKLQCGVREHHIS